jgi:hypothetical protein
VRARALQRGPAAVVVALVRRLAEAAALALQSVAVKAATVVEVWALPPAQAAARGQR